MSKKVEYPDGSVGFASDKAAAILAKKPGHKIVGEAPKAEPKKVEAEHK